jgi:hypothetical protein
MIKKYNQFLNESKSIELLTDIKDLFNVELDVQYLIADIPAIYIQKLLLPESDRKQGKGTEIMNLIINWADKHNTTLTLTPESTFGTPVNTLKKFYKKFGFHENKGRNKDFRFRASMVRFPTNSNETVYESEKIEMESFMEQQIHLYIQEKKLGKHHNGNPIYILRIDAIDDIDQTFKELADLDNITNYKSWLNKTKKSFLNNLNKLNPKDFTYFIYETEFTVILKALNKYINNLDLEDIFDEID